MGISVPFTTKHFTHHADQLQRALITDTVKDTIRILAGNQDAFFPEDGEMLGNIALRGSNGIDNFLNTSFLVTQNAEYFQAQRMGNGFQGSRRSFNMLLLFNQAEGRCFQVKTPV